MLHWVWQMGQRSADSFQDRISGKTKFVCVHWNPSSYLYISFWRAEPTNIGPEVEGNAEGVQAPLPRRRRALGNTQCLQQCFRNNSRDKPGRIHLRTSASARVVRSSAWSTCKLLSESGPTTYALSTSFPQIIFVPFAEQDSGDMCSCKSRACIPGEIPKDQHAFPITQGFESSTDPRAPT